MTLTMNASPIASLVKSSHRNWATSNEGLELGAGGLHCEAQGGQHAHAAVGQLGLAVPTRAPWRVNGG